MPDLRLQSHRVSYPTFLRALLAGCVVLAGLVAVASSAAAEEIGLVVERSAQTDEPIPLVLMSDAQGPIEVTVHRLHNPTALIDAGVALGNGNALAWLGTGRDAVTMRRERPQLAALYSGATPERVMQRTLPGPHKGPRRRLVPLTWPGYGPGLFLIEARSASVTARATAIVSDLAVVLKRDPRGALLWTLNRRTGRAWSAVGITALEGSSAERRTGADGTLRLQGALPATLGLRAVAGAHLALGSETWFPTRSTDHRVYLFPHQPAYRPGERVALKGIVRAFDGNRLRVDPALEDARITLFDARGGTVHEARAHVTADHGTFELDFTLAEDAPTGRWRAEVQFDAEATRGRVYEGAFLVDAYRKPAFEVSVRADEARVLAGSPSTFEIAASFYDGGPVGNARVTWQVLYNRVDADLLPTDELVELFFGSEREAYKPQTLATGEGTLDANGRLQLPVNAPAGAMDGYLSVRATVIGPDRVAVAGSGGIAVDASPLRVALRANKTVHAPEDIAAIDIVLETAAGKPAVARSGLLTVARIVPGTPETEAWLRDLEFTTDARGKAQLELPLTGEGQLRLSVAVPRAANEPAGPAAHASIDVWIAGDKPTLGLPPARLEVIADREQYAPGDTARLLVRAPGTRHAVLATLEGATLLRHEVLTGNEGASIWQVQIDRAHAPNVFATFVSAGDGDMQVRTVQLQVPPAHMLLTATITPDAEMLEPGSTSGVTVQVTDATGAPVAGAELTLAIVDEALYALHRDAQAPLAAFFHAARRNNVSTQSITHHDSVGRNVVRPPAPRRAGGPGAPGGADGGEAPTGGAPAPTSPAMPNPTPNDDPAAPAESAAPMTGEAAPEDAAVPDAEVLEEAEEAERSTRDSMFDDGVDGDARLRLDSKKSKQGGGASVQEVREDFRSCVYWNARIVTDAAGRARIDAIPYADSLTRWRVRAWLVDGETRVGEARVAVVTRKALSLRLTAPRFLRVGDEARAPILVRNLSGDTLPVQWRAQALAGTTPAGRTDGGAQLAAGALARDTLPLEATAVGVLQLDATATSGARGDALRFDIPTLPQGITKATGGVLVARDGEGSLTLRVPARAEPGSIEASVRIEGHPIQAVLAAAPYLVGYPHGCTEQTLSRFGPLMDIQAALRQLDAPTPEGLGDLDAMIATGVRRLESLRQPNGGFGWWPQGDLDPAMTALAVRTLTQVVARKRATPAQNAIHTAARTLRDGARARLASMVSKADVRARLDEPTLALIALALTESGAQRPNIDPLLPDIAKSTHPLVRAYSLQIATRLGDAARIAAARDALVAALVTGPTGSRRLGRIEATDRTWQDDGIEATAEALAALVGAGEQDGALLDALAQGLLEARTAGDRWRSTRDTAAAVRALAAHAVRGGPEAAPRKATLWAGETALMEIVVDRAYLLAGAKPMAVPAEMLVPGAEVTLRLETEGSILMAPVAITYVDTGPAIDASESGFTVSRTWYALTPSRDASDRVVWTREPVTESLPTGTLVECEITIESPTPRTYVMVTDPHIAGFEPALEVGMDVPGRTPAAPAHRERYDEATCFFFSALPRGRVVVRHLMRATHLGNYTALPASAELMYFPAIRGNSGGAPFEVRAREEGGAR